jgi:helix-turn-helix protein
LTLYTLGTFMDRDGFAYPGQATLAKGARASVRTIRRHIDQAQALGWIGVSLAGNSGQAWRHYAYRCCIPDDVFLDEKDDALADVVASQHGDIEATEGADSIVSSPNGSRADIAVSAASVEHPAKCSTKPTNNPVANETCGHPTPEGADIRSTTCGQAGGQKVRTKLVPTNSRSETPVLRTHVRVEAQPAEAGAHVVADATKAEEKKRKIRALIGKGIDPEDIPKILQVLGVTRQEVANEVSP